MNEAVEEVRRVKLVLGTSPRRLVQSLLAGMLAAAWSVFINIVNLWILTPLVTDLAVLGILFVLAIAAVWLFSVPRIYRRQAAVFTLFGLLLGQGLETLIQARSLPLVLVSVAVLVILMSWFGRVTLLSGAMAAAALLILNWQLPLRDWDYLSHFKLLSDTPNSIDVRAFPITPLFTVQTGQTQRVVTLQNINHAAVPTYLDGSFRYVQISAQAGPVRIGPARPNTLAYLPQGDVSSMMSPLAEPSWHVKDGQLNLSFLSSMSTQDYALLAPEFLTTQSVLQDRWATSVAANEKAWRQALAALNVKPATTGFAIRHGVLQGTFADRNVDVAVAAGRIVAEGSFSGIHKHELLLEGKGFLQVVSLDRHPHVISTYRPPDSQWLSGQIVTGPINTSGRDAVFIDSNGMVGEVAHVVAMSQGNKWRVLYTAPNPYLRFLAAVQFKPGSAPQILANDSSTLRPTASVYLTSYAYRNGQLERNWRMGVNDVNNAASATLTAGSAPDIVLAAGQHLVVLSHSRFPAVPISAAMLAVLIVIGLSWQYVRRRGQGD